MAQDTLVGMLGALLIVGSMAGVLQLTGDQDSPGDGEDRIVGNPPPLGLDTWTAETCRQITAIWHPSQQALQAEIGPRWQPAQGPQAGQGVFGLTTYDCPRMAVSGLDEGATQGGMAWVLIRAPEDPQNVTARTWKATPELFTPGDGDLHEALTDHTFQATEATVEITTTDLLAGSRVQSTLTTSDGTVILNAIFTAQGAQRTVHEAHLGVDDRFAAINGTAQGTTQETGQAAATSQGDTWVSRLNLATQPARVVLTEDLSWDRSIFDAPFMSPGTP